MAKKKTNFVTGSAEENAVAKAALAARIELTRAKLTGAALKAYNQGLEDGYLNGMYGYCDLANHMGSSSNSANRRKGIEKTQSARQKTYDDLVEIVKARSEMKDTDLAAEFLALDKNKYDAGIRGKDPTGKIYRVRLRTLTDDWIPAIRESHGLRRTA